MSCKSKRAALDEFLELLEETYFGVIDVQYYMQLKSLSDDLREEPEPYVALSYVWDEHSVRSYITTRSDVLMHIQSGGLKTAWEKLPLAIQDATNITFEKIGPAVYLDRFTLYRPG